jgi:hypothetical protein
LAWVKPISFFGKTPFIEVGARCKVPLPTSLLLEIRLLFNVLEFNPFALDDNLSLLFVKRLALIPLIDEIIFSLEAIFRLSFALIRLIKELDLKLLVLEFKSPLKLLGSVFTDLTTRPRGRRIPGSLRFEMLLFMEGLILFIPAVLLKSVVLRLLEKLLLKPLLLKFELAKPALFLVFVRVPKELEVTKPLLNPPLNPEILLLPTMPRKPLFPDPPLLKPLPPKV